MAHNKLLKYAAKNAAGQLLAGFAKNTRNCPLAKRYIPNETSTNIFNMGFNFNFANFVFW
ncbi:hypothetical protein [Aliiglaciecola litoralis]|uniref:Uncharacterized protein n=1 Tax=Aliiglaciecola litoralis TaxID=582857 RepID=A0ABP3X8I2_9ALTE